MKINKDVSKRLIKLCKERELSVNGLASQCC